MERPLTVPHWPYTEASLTSHRNLPQSTLTPHRGQTQIHIDSAQGSLEHPHGRYTETWLMHIYPTRTFHRPTLTPYRALRQTHTDPTKDPLTNPHGVILPRVLSDHCTETSLLTPTQTSQAFFRIWAFDSSWQARYHLTNHAYCCLECKLVQQIFKIVWQFFK